MNRQHVGNPVPGTVSVRNAQFTGVFKPSIFFTTSMFRMYPSQTVLGVLHASQPDAKESEYYLHTVATAFNGKPMTILGPRWAAFITALLESGHTVNEELAREAWFATNNEPTSHIKSMAEHGRRAMEAQLGTECVARIRGMTGDPLF